MLSDAVRYPSRGDDWVMTLLVGSVLTLLGVLILPTFVVLGYLVRVLRGGAAAEQTPPSFTDWGRLFVDGLRLFAVTLVYSLVIVVPVVVLLASLLVAIPQAPVPTDPGVPAPTPSTGSTVGVVVALVLLAVAALVALAAGFLLPAAMANFAIEGRLGAAFAVRTLLAGALTGEYVVAWILAVVVGIVGGLVGSALSVVLVGVVVLFYVQVSVYYLFGRGFAAGIERKRDRAVP